MVSLKVAQSRTTRATSSQATVRLGRHACAESEGKGGVCHICNAMPHPVLRCMTCKYKRAPPHSPHGASACRRRPVNGTQAPKTFALCQPGFPSSRFARGDDGKSKVACRRKRQRCLASGNGQLCQRRCGLADSVRLGVEAPSHRGLLALEQCCEGKEHDEPMIRRIAPKARPAWKLCSAKRCMPRSANPRGASMIQTSLRIVSAT